MADSSGISDAARGGRLGRQPGPTMPVCVVPRDARGAKRDARELVEHEWLLTNGLGGFSSGTVASVITRRYHGLLVAALPNPLGRMVMFNTLDDELEVDSLTEFRLDAGVPVWRYTASGGVIEKRVIMPYRQNTVIIQYNFQAGATGGSARELRLTPAVHFRPYDAPVSEPLHEDYDFVREGEDFRLTTAGLPSLRFAWEGPFEFVPGATRREQILFPVEESRGYQKHGSLWSPGTFVAPVSPGESVALIASTEDVDVMRAMS
ncbi:MAG: glycogen debranching enzyme N-terminal domain-containing protein, partial [Gemmatimonadaceae bacterium]